MTETRREREKIARKMDILAAAKEVLSKKPFGEATLEEIAEKAEFAKGTIYGYFKNKEDLFICLIKEEFDRWTKAVSPALAEGLKPLERLRILAEEELRFHRENLEIYKIYLYHEGFITIIRQDKSPSSLAEHTVQEYQKTLYECRVKTLETFERVIRTCQDAGYYKDKDPRFLALIFLGVVHSVIAGWIMGQLKKPIPEIVSDILDLIPVKST
jgi:TetR/AcrR family transcriptional regulator